MTKWRKPGDFSSMRIPPMPWMNQAPIEISVSWMCDPPDQLSQIVVAPCASMLPQLG